MGLPTIQYGLAFALSCVHGHEHNRPFEMLLDPQVNPNALTWAATDKARTSTDIDAGVGSSHVRGVGAEGLEPPPSSL